MAAAWVVVYHLWGQAPNHPMQHWYQVWRDGGYLGVSVFFVLSGFILAYNAQEIVDKGRFYALRFARVYPLYLAALLWALPNYLRHGMRGQTGVGSWVALPASLLLLQGWFGPSVATQINAPGWSLSHEAFFYVMFPFALPLVKRWMHRWRWMLAGLAVLAILPSSTVHVWMAVHRQAAPGWWQDWFMALPLCWLSTFLIGAVLGRLFRERMPRVSGTQMLLACTVSMLCVLVHGHLPFDLVRAGLLALPFGWLIYSLAGWESKLLRSRPLQLAGEISYGVYLLQIPLYMTVNQLGLNQGGMRLLECVLLLPVAYVFYRMVEKPGRRMLLRGLGVRSMENVPERIAEPVRVS